MKTRIESLEWKGILEIDLPNTPSFQNLKDAIAAKISAPSESLHLSLNRENELIASPMASLTSIGILPDTQIYYTRYPNKLISPSPQEKTKIPLTPSSSLFGILQKVCKDAIFTYEGDEYKLYVKNALHSFFLGFGFVCLDPKIETLRYTTPQLLRASGGDDRVFRTVNLKFETMGKWVSVQQFLTWGNHGEFLWLDASRFVPSLQFVCKNETEDEDEDGDSFHQRKILEMWKIVKDGLKLPLIIDHFDKIRPGLESESSSSRFMSLPTEVRLKILEFLPGIDIAKIGCVCAELNHLSSEDDLWKNKCIEEFSLSKRELPIHQCKYIYALSWKRRRMSTTSILQSNIH